MLTIGWREWIALPELGIRRIKAKIDTGARTSALHAFRVDCFEEKGKTKVSFSLHPKQKNKIKVVDCIADLLEMRWVTDSGGHREYRPVIATTVLLGGRQWPVEITLTSRDDMRFRLLLGRTAIRHHFVVDPSTSFLMGKHPSL